MKIKLLWCGMAVILISVIAAGTAAFFNREMIPELCVDLCTAENMVYGIDYHGEKQVYQIYRCSIEGRDMISILQKAERNNYRYVYDKITCDMSSGKIYVHISQFASNTGLLKGETVFQCDFENQKLIPMWEIPVDVDNSTSSFAIICVVRKDVLYYLSEDVENGYRVYEQKGISKKAVRDITCSDEAVFSRYHFNDDGRLYAFSTTGGLYLENEMGVLQPISGVNNLWNSYANPAWGEHDAYCIDLTHQKEITYSQKDDLITKNDMLDSYSITSVKGDSGVVYSIDYDMLTNHCLLKGDGFIAYSELPDFIKTSRLQSGLAVYQNNKMTIYPSISYSSSYIIRYFFKWFGVILGVSALILIAIFIVYILFRKKRYISILIETTLFAALLFGSAIGFTSYIINWIMTESFNASYQKVFDDLEQEICCELDMIIKQTENFSEEILFSENFHNKLSQIMQNTIIKNPKTGREEFAPYFVFHGLNSQNRLIVLYNSSGRELIPTSYTYNNSYINNEYSAVLNDHVNRNLTQYDTEGIWNVQLCPYENTDYNVYGVVEIGIDQYLTDWKTGDITSGIVRFILTLCVIMVAVIIIFLGFSFLPIRRLGKQVELGDVENPGKSWQSIETAAIWERLYVMTFNVKRRQNELDINNQQHYRFVSLELVKLLGLKELADAKPGIYRKCSLSLLYILFQKQGIEHIGRLYEEILPQTDKLGGVICRMESDRILILFQRDNKNIADAAKQIRQTAGRRNTKCGIGIVSGIIDIFVRGTENCADIAVWGKEAERAEQLAKQSLKEKIAEKIL